MNYDSYYIPTNFTDAGRVMGLFELRNLVEAVILTLPALYLCLAFLPLDMTTKLVVTLSIRPVRKPVKRRVESCKFRKSKRREGRTFSVCFCSGKRGYENA